MWPEILMYSKLVHRPLSATEFQLFKDGSSSPVSINKLCKTQRDYAFPSLPLRTLLRTLETHRNPSYFSGFRDYSITNPVLLT